MMLKTLFLLGIPVLIAGGCSKPSIQAEDCSITLNGISFTKSLNQGKSVSQLVGANKLIMKSGPKTDYFNEPNQSAKYGNAPMLLTSVDNKSPFTFVTKVSPQFTQTYDAGALYIYVDPDKWHKFAYEMDERKITRLVTVRTSGTSDDNNHDASTASSVFLKISSDGKQVGFYYSQDSTNWQVTRVYRNDYPETIWLGISAQSPMGEGNSSAFESCTFSKDAVKDFRMGI
ncbi:MAG: DUF1349 domain-containing protein [Saprospiraceae bacterium]|nr:DUF1349 domain-containing protein [Saprospiraceae bacterium]